MSNDLEALVDERLVQLGSQFVGHENSPDLRAAIKASVVTELNAIGRLIGYEPPWVNTQANRKIVQARIDAHSN